MEKRICPNCGAENYSAQMGSSWECHKCGKIIPKPSREKHML